MPIVGLQSATLLASSSALMNRSVETALRSIFPEPGDETKVQRARRVLGAAACGVSDDQLEVFVTELQFLIDAWLDAYEREAFGGMTLRQLLRSQ